MTQSPPPKPKRPKRKEKLSDIEQSERFIETARSLDVNDTITKFDAILSKIAVPMIRQKKAS